MSGQVKIILNAGGGRLSEQAKIALINQAMQKTGLDYHLETTYGPEQGLTLARRAACEGWPIVVAAGGDGTINQIVNGLLQASEGCDPIRLGIIPLGTANDLADMLALPRDITAACQRLTTDSTRLIDVGLVNGRYFVNNSAIGLEAIVTLTHDQMRWIKGDLRYLVAALKAIGGGRHWDIRLEWDNGLYEGPTSLVSVGNSRRTGGSFYMTPQARLDDGLLDFIYTSNLSRMQMLGLLPKTFSGKHINHPFVVYLKTKKLSITTSPSTPIQVDGEVID